MSAAALGLQARGLTAPGDDVEWPKPGTPLLVEAEGAALDAPLVPAVSKRVRSTDQAGVWTVLTEALQLTWVVLDDSPARRGWMSAARRHDELHAAQAAAAGQLPSFVPPPLADVLYDSPPCEVARWHSARGAR